MQRYGALFREVVQGLMEVLRARASLKSEFRMMLTTIRPVENNPLKFSPNVDDAMRNLFISSSGGYLSPIESVREGFDDIKNHQMAMVAGMQEAFRDMLGRLSPESFEKSAKIGGVRGAFMPVGKKSHAWDAYCEFYKTITQDPANSFQILFGEEFARAYEEQIKRLTLLRNR
jgi:type VI secretion system FHA domain protein